MNGLYGGADMARVLYGENARHVPAYLYVQDAGPGLVSFTGSSMTPGQDNPLRYGAGHWRSSDDNEGYRPHHLIVGEIIVRPHVVITTSALSGFGLAQMLTDGPGIEELTDGGQGELVIGTSAQLAEIVHRSRTGAWRG
jgi:hypothetical protein